MSEQLLALDVGNTNTVVGLFAGEELLGHWRLTTQADRTADEIGMWLRQLLQWEQLSPSDLIGVAVSSVVPPMDPRLREGVRRYLNQTPFFVEPGIKTGMPLNIQPAHWPTNAVPASAAIIAAQQAGGGDIGQLVHNILKACWAEDRDIAEDAVLRDCLTAAGFEADIAGR